MGSVTTEGAKERAALAAVALVEEGSTIAVGSGSTVDKAIRALGRRFEGSLRKPAVVAASRRSEMLVTEAGLPLLMLDKVTSFPLMLDGADEVAPDLTLIKGGGGALTREKLLATLSQSVVIMVDYTKLVQRIGEHALLPVEVVPFAAPYVGRKLRELNLEPTVRISPGAAIVPYLTDNHCEILDCRLPSGVFDPEELEANILKIRGVLDCGLFVRMANRVFVGTRDGRVEEMHPPTSPPRLHLPEELREALLRRMARGPVTPPVPVRRPPKARKATRPSPHRRPKGKRSR